MGLLISKFYRKPLTKDTLERLEQEIQNIEERRYDKRNREHFIIQILSFLPIIILIVNVCILIYPSDTSWKSKLLHSVPLIILNLVLWSCKKMVRWYSNWSLMNDETELRKLQKEKKRILEMVCETESYKVASELLEKYDPKQLRRRERSSQDRAPATSANTSLTKLTASPIKLPAQQRQMHPAQSPIVFHNQSLNLQQQMPILPTPPPPTPMTKPVTTISDTSIAAATAPTISTITKTQLNTTSTNLLNKTTNSIAASSVQGRPVRPILNKDRSLIEKVVDWVVADGPDNRFALICRYCYGHNGMSLAEEYETINFRCCYCYNLNTAKSKNNQVHDQLQPEREKVDKPESTKDTKESEKAKEAEESAEESTEELDSPCATIREQPEIANSSGNGAH